MKRPSNAVIATGVIALLAGVGIGSASAEEAVADVAAPTPQVVIVTPEPQPEPTPKIVTETVTEEVEVETVPQSCLDAIDSLSEGYQQLLDNQIEVLSAYADHPEEDLVEFGRRFEDLVAGWDDPTEVDWNAVTDCQSY